MASEAGARAIPPAGVLGRLGRGLVGSVQVFYSIQCLRFFHSMTHPSLTPGIWPFVLFALWILPTVVNRGFRRVLGLGYRPLWAVLAVAVALSAWDGVRAGAWWGPSVAIWLLAITIYTHLHNGVSHLLAAAAGLAGCEMRVVPYYWVRLRGGKAAAELCRCPGFWTPLDRWEASLRGASG